MTVMKVREVGMILKIDEYLIGKLQHNLFHIVFFYCNKLYRAESCRAHFFILLEFLVMMKIRMLKSATN